VASRAVAVRPPARIHSLWRTTTRFARTWPYLLPALFFFVGWQLWPILRALWISFTSFSFLLDDSPESAKWIWFQNYVEAVKDPLVRQGLWRAAIFTAIFLPGMVFLPMVTAVLVDRVSNRKVAATYRLILLIPAMIPGPLIFILWVWMYSNGIGPVNYMLVNVLHLYDVTNQPTWLGSTNLTFGSLAVMEWWWGLGFHTMFYLAGLATIPKELYESARGERVAHLLEDHVRAPAADPARARRASLRHRVRADRRVHPDGRIRARPAHVHLDGLHVGHGLPGR
jgi:multiple sugar transport system permease protein